MTIVAVPGVRTFSVGGGTLTGMLRVHEHGWPFTHYYSTELVAVGRNTANQGDVEILLERAETAFLKRKLRWSAAPKPTSNRFWSNPENWKRMATNFYGHFVLSGMLANLSVVAATLFGSIALVEYRRKSMGRLSRFRLLDAQGVFDI